MPALLTDRYHDRLSGVLSCYDRIVITGTLPGACFAEGMTKILKARGIRVFDYAAQFAAPLRDRVREAAAALAAAAGVSIEHIAKNYIRKEDVVAKVLAVRGSHSGLVQVEYSTDLVFRSQAILTPLYEQLARQAVLGVKAEHVATFLGHKITPQLAQEVGSRFTTRIEGTCIRHRFGKSAIKMYDKFALVLRLETTSNDVSCFKHHRKVEHRKGPATRALAPVKKTIYSLPDLREILVGCNRRYLAFLSALDDFSAGVRALDRLTQPPPSAARLSSRP